MKRVFSAAVVLPAAFAFSLFVSSGCYISTSNGSFHIGLGFGAKAEREETHDLAITTGQKLSVDVPYGDFRLHTTSSGSPTLHAKITSHGPNEADAQKVVDAAHLKIESTSEGLVVRVDDTPVDPEVEGGTTRVTSRFDLDIQLPPGVRLALVTESGEIEAVGPFASSELRSSYGKVAVSTVEGNLAIRSGSGSVEATTVHGERIEAVTSYGHVRLSDCDAKTVIGKSSSGNVRMQSVHADHIAAESNYGNAELAHLHGDLEVELSSGSVHVEDLTGAHHKLKSNYGSLNIVRAKGDLEAETSSGSIKIKEFEGRLRAHSGYGSVNAEGIFFELAADSSSGTVDVRADSGSKVDGAWKLSSSYGAVKLGVAPDLSCELSAQTGYGKIDVQVPLEVLDGGIHPGKSLRVKINAGGELVSLESSSGNVKFYPLN